MLEILQFYVSNFWVWAGLTILVALVCSSAVDMAREIFFAISKIWGK